LATVAIVIKKKEQKNDGTWRVKFRVTHKGKPAYINSDTYVDKSQLTRSLEIKDQDVFINLSDKLKEYRTKISELGDLQHLTVNDIKSILTSKEFRADEIDFLAIMQLVIDERKADNRTGDLDNLRMVRNSLIDYFGREKVPITEITSSMLHDYDRYLKKPRKLVRKDRDGNEYTVDSEPLGRNGVIRHMMMIRLCFNEAKRKYNNPDTGQIVIAHYPFERYKIQKPTASMHRVISLEAFRTIEAAKCIQGSRAEVGRDLFLLSFYLCGMNAVDMLKLPLYKGEERIEYNRSKTMDKRADKAFISIKVPDQAKPLLKKWAGQLQTLYSNRKTLIRAINEGLAALGFPEVTFYYARHTFSTWANKQGMSIPQIAKALNHVEQRYKITGIYVEPNWDEVDAVQSAAIGFLGQDIDDLIQSVS